MATTKQSAVTEDPRPLWRRFSAPRYWPVWLGIALMRLISGFPFAWQLALGQWLGRLFGRFARYRRHIAEVNLRLCFPELSPKQRRSLLEAHCVALGIGLFETAMAWWGSDDKIRALGEIEGMEHLDRALAQGKGVILLTAHFAPLELGARFITLHRPFHAIYRSHKNALYEAVMRRERERRSRLEPIIREDIRGMLHSLKRGHALWYAPDQNYGPRNSIFVPFFGVPALTITATSRLAKLSGALVVPYFPQRLPGRAGYRVTILPPLQDFPSADAAADALRINRLIEGWIRRMPEQYLWLHRRFKQGPPELGDVYRA